MEGLSNIRPVQFENVIKNFRICYQFYNRQVTKVTSIFILHIVRFDVIINQFNLFKD